MGILDRFKTKTEMPEVEVTDFPTGPTLVIAGDIQEYKMWKRVRKQPDAIYIPSLDKLRDIRGANIVFTGSWGFRNPQGPELWDYANAGGNNATEDIIL